MSNIPVQSVNYDQDLTQLAIVAYTSYTQGIASESFTGDPFSNWKDLPLESQEAWKRVVLSVSKKIQYS